MNTQNVVLVFSYLVLWFRFSNQDPNFINELREATDPFANVSDLLMIQKTGQHSLPWCLHQT